MENIVFDLYGTLVDIHTDENQKNFWKKFAKLLRKHGVQLYYKEARAEYFRLCLLAEKELSLKNPGKKIEINISEVFYQLCSRKRPNITRKESDELGAAFRKLSTAYIRLYPDTIPVLSQLKEKGKHIWLLSNAQALFTLPELDQLGLTKYFDGIAISSEAGVKKPDGAFAEYLFERFKITADTCIMIGNEYGSDVLAAKASGMDYIFIESNLTPEYEIGVYPEAVHTLGEGIEKYQMKI